jgi:hypothetical protein
MRKYLTWLELGDNGQEASPTRPARGEEPPRAEPTRAAPAVAKAVPAAQPATPAAGPESGRHKRKHRHRHRHKHRKEHVPAAVPVGLPYLPPGAAAAAPAVNQVASLADVDVELVPLTQQPGQRAASGLTRRDWLLLSLGGGAVIVAGIIGIVIKLILGWFGS